MNLGANVNCYRCIFLNFNGPYPPQCRSIFICTLLFMGRSQLLFLLLFFPRVLILISQQKLLPRRMRNIKFLLFASSSHHKYYVYERSLNKLSLSFLLLCAFNFIKIIKITFPRAFETHSLASVVFHSTRKSF